jgi:hypothetical protein
LYRREEAARRSTIAERLYRDDDVVDIHALNLQRNVCVKYFSRDHGTNYPGRMGSEPYCGRA